MALSVEIAKAFISVGVQMEGLEKGLAQARHEAEAAARDLGKHGADAARKTEGGWLDAGKGLAKALLAGWAAMKVGDAIKESVQIAQESLRFEGRLTFVLGNAAEAAQALNELRSLSMQTGESFQALGEAYIKLRKEGEDATSAMQQLVAAQKLARVTGEELRDTADNLNDIFGLFQGQFTDFSEFADKMAVATRNVGGSLNGLMEALKITGPMAQSLGINFEQLTGMLAELQNRGYESARAANALVEAFSKAEQLKLRLPSQEVQAQLEAIAGDIAKTEALIKSLKASLENVPKGTDEWKRITQEIETQKTNLKLLQGAAKELEDELKLPQDVELIYKKLGDSAREAFAAFKEGKLDFLGFVKALGDAGATASDLSMLFGSASAKMLEALIPALNDSKSAMSRLNEEFKNSKGALDAATGSIDKGTDAFQRIGRALDVLRETLGRSLLNMALPALEKLADSLQQVAEGKIPNIMVEMFGSEAAAREFVSTIQEVGKTVGSVLVDAFKNIVPLLGDVLKLWGNLLALLKDLNVFDAAGKAIEAIANLFKSVLSTMNLVINLIRGDWAAAWKNVQDIFGGVVKVVEGVFGAIERLGQGLKGVLEHLLGIKREVAATPAAATAEEQVAMSQQRTLAASLEKLGPDLAKRVQAITLEAMKIEDQKRAVEVLIKAIYQLASAEGKLPAEIGSAIYDVLVVQGNKELARALNEAFKASGMGKPQGKQEGGLVRGTGVGDVVPARLEPGEFVIRKEAVKHYGPGFLYALNERAFRPMRGLGVLLADIGADIMAVYGSRFGTGGKVPGVGVGDRVPALLEPGEFVVRKDAVQYYGLPRLMAINERALPRFQSGGLVGPISQLSVAEIAQLAEQHGMWWVPYRRLAMDEMRTLWKQDPVKFKEKLLKALVWGIMHVREQVGVAERMYSDFFAGKVPTVEQLARELGYTRSALLNLVRAPMSDADAADLMRRVLEKYPNFPRKLGVTKVQAIIGALGFIEDLKVEQFMKAGLEGRMGMIMENVKGLGPAKSAFALASLGVDDIATIDVWMGKSVLLPALERIAALPDEEIARLGYTRAELQAKIAAWKNKGGAGWKNIKDYLRDVYAAFGDISTSGTRQWEAYWSILGKGGVLESASVAFRKESHLPFFRELGISKELAAQKYGINVARADQAARIQTLLQRQDMKALFDLASIGEKRGMPTLAELIAQSDFNRLYTVKTPARVQGIGDMVTRYLEGATIIERPGLTIVQVLGNEHISGQVEALARELAKQGETVMTTLPVKGTPTVATFVKGAQTAKTAERAASELLLESLGIAGQLDESFIRLYTERKENLEALARKFLGNQFKISEALGVWRGGQELSAMIDIPFSPKNAALATELARMINEVNNQSEVLMALYSAETGQAGARRITERATEFTQKLAQNLLRGGREADWAFAQYRILYHKHGATIADLAEELGIETRMMDDDLIQALRIAGLEATGLFTADVPHALKRAGVRIAPGYEGLALLHNFDATIGTMTHEIGHGLDYMISKYAPRAIPFLKDFHTSAYKTFEGILDQPGYLAELLKITHKIRGITGWKSVDEFLLNFAEKNKVFGRQKIINLLEEGYTNEIIELIKKEAARSGQMLSERAFVGFDLGRFLAYPLSPSELFADFFRGWVLSYEETKALAPRSVDAFEKLIIPALKSVSPKVMGALEKFAARIGRSVANLALFLIPSPMDVDIASLESALAWLLKNYRITPDEAEAIYEYEIGQRVAMLISGIENFVTGRGMANVDDIKPLAELDAEGNLVVSKHGGPAAGRLLATAEEVKKHLGGWGFVKTRNIGGLVVATLNQLLLGALGSEFQRISDIQRSTDNILEWVRWHRESSPWALEMVYGEMGPKPFKSGGVVPGVGTGDKVPALLEPGEFVVPRETVKKYGKGFFEKMRMQKGGFVPPVPVLEEEIIPWEEIAEAVAEAQAKALAEALPLGGGMTVGALSSMGLPEKGLPVLGGLTVGAAAAGGVAEAPMSATVGMAARGELPRPLVGLPGVGGLADKREAGGPLPLSGLSVAKVSDELVRLGEAAQEAAGALQRAAKGVGAIGAKGGKGGFGEEGIAAYEVAAREAAAVTVEATAATQEQTRAVVSHKHGIERAERATGSFAATVQQATANTKTVLDEFAAAVRANAQGFVNRVFGPLGEVISALIGGGPLVGALVNAFFGLMMQSKEFGKLMEEVNPIIEALADVVGMLLSPLTEFFKWLRQLLGIKKKTPQRMPGAMNIPSGFKMERARFRATAPGEPGAAEGPAADIGKILKGLAIGAIIWAAFKFIAGRLKGLAGPIMKLIAGALGFGVTPLGDLGQWAFDAIKGVARGGLRALRGLGRWIMSAVKVVGDIAVEAGKLAWEFVEAVIEVGGRVIADIVNFAVEFVNAALELTGRVVGDIVNFAVKFVNAALELTGKVIGDLVNFTVKFVRAALELTGRVIGDIVNFAVKFVNAALELTGKVVGDLVNFAVKFVRAALELTGKVLGDIVNFAVKFVNAALELTGRVVGDLVDFAVKFVKAAIEVGGKIAVDAINFVWNAAQTTIRIVGQVALDALAVAWDLATDVLAGAGNLLKNVAVAAWESAVSVVGAAGNALREIAMAAWNLLVNGLKAGGTWLYDMARGAWDALVNALKGAGTWLYDMARGAWDALVNVLKGTGAWLYDMARGAWNALVSGLKGAGTWLYDMARGAWDALVNGLKGAGTWLYDIARSAWDALVNGLRSTGTWLYDMARNAWDALVNGLRGAGTWLHDMARGAWNALVNSLKGAGTWLYDAARGAWDALVNGLRSTGTWLYDMARGAWDALVNGLRSTGTWLYDMARGAWDALVNGLRSTGTWLYDMARGAWNALVNSLKGAGTWLYDAARGAWDALVNGLRSTGTWLYDMARGAWDALVNGLRSTGTWLYDMARGTWDALVAGLRGAGTWLYDTARGAWDALVGLLRGTGTWLYDMARGAWDALVNGLRGAGTWLYDMARGAWNALTVSLKGAGTWLYDTARGAWDALVGGLRGAGTWLYDTARGAWDALVGLLRGTGTWVYDMARGAWNTLVSGLTSAGNWVYNLAYGAWNTLTGALKTPVSWLKDVLGGAWSALVDGLGKPFGWLKDILKTAWEKMTAVFSGPVQVQGQVTANASSSGVRFDFSNLVVQFAGQVGASLGGQTGPGGQIGGQVGGAIGGAIGGALFGPMGQIGGAFIGSFLGNIIGGMFDAGPLRRKLEELKEVLQVAGDYVSLGIDPWWESFRGERIGNVVQRIVRDIDTMIAREPWRGKENKVAILRATQVIKSMLQTYPSAALATDVGYLEQRVRALQTGGLVKTTMASILHPGEVVLRPHLVDRLESLLNKLNSKGSRIGLPGQPVTILPVKLMPLPGVGIPRLKPEKPDLGSTPITIAKEAITKLDRMISGEYTVGAPAAIVVQGDLVIDDREIVRAVQDYIERRRLTTKGIKTGVI